MLLSAPVYFNYKEINKGTVLVNRGKLVKEDISERFGNRQFFFMDEDKKLKCVNGGQIAYIVDQHNLADGKKEVKITYDGKVKLENGKYAGKEANQFLVELVNEDEVFGNPDPLNAESIKAVQDAMTTQDSNELE